MIFTNLTDQIATFDVPDTHSQKVTSIACMTRMKWTFRSMIYSFSILAHTLSYDAVSHISLFTEFAIQNHQQTSDVRQSYPVFRKRYGCSIHRRQTSTDKIIISTSHFYLQLYLSQVGQTNSLVKQSSSNRVISF